MPLLVSVRLQKGRDVSGHTGISTIARWTSRTRHRSYEKPKQAGNGSREGQDMDIKATGQGTSKGPQLGVRRNEHRPGRGRLALRDYRDDFGRVRDLLVMSREVRTGDSLLTGHTTVRLASAVPFAWLSLECLAPDYGQRCSRAG